MKRVLIYAAIYGSVGVAIGVMMALYTKDVPLPQNIILSNGSNHKTSAGGPVAPVEDATPAQVSNLEDE